MWLQQGFALVCALGGPPGCAPVFISTRRLGKLDHPVRVLSSNRAFSFAPSSFSSFPAFPHPHTSQAHTAKSRGSGRRPHYTSLPSTSISRCKAPFLGCCYCRRSSPGSFWDSKKSTTRRTPRSRACKDSFLVARAQTLLT